MSRLAAELCLSSISIGSAVLLALLARTSFWGAILASIIWIACGALAYGFDLAFWQREFPRSAKLRYVDDKRNALVFSLGGVISLMLVLFWREYRHGWGIGRKGWYQEISEKAKKGSRGELHYFLNEWEAVCGINLLDCTPLIKTDSGIRCQRCLSGLSTGALIKELLRA